MQTKPNSKYWLSNITSLRGENDLISRTLQNMHTLYAQICKSSAMAITTNKRSVYRTVELKFQLYHFQQETINHVRNVKNNLWMKPQESNLCNRLHEVKSLIKSTQRSLRWIQNSAFFAAENIKVSNWLLNNATSYHSLDTTYFKYSYSLQQTALW
jgi:phosphomevalonate kinase